MHGYDIKAIWSFRNFEQCPQMLLQLHILKSFSLQSVQSTPELCISRLKVLRKTLAIAAQPLVFLPELVLIIDQLNALRMLLVQPALQLLRDDAALHQGAVVGLSQLPRKMLRFVRIPFPDDLVLRLHSLDEGVFVLDQLANLHEHQLVLFQRLGVLVGQLCQLVRLPVPVDEGVEDFHLELVELLGVLGEEAESVLRVLAVKESTHFDEFVSYLLEFAVEDCQVSAVVEASRRGILDSCPARCLCVR